MVDFAKMRDPVWRAEQAAIRKAEDDAAEELSKFVTSAIDRCTLGHWALETKELEFVRSCATQVNGYCRPLTSKQLKWLSDLEYKVDGRMGFITVNNAMRGYIAVHMSTSADSLGDYSPQQTGIGSYRTAQDASVEAREWAESEGLRFVEPGAKASGPELLKELLEKRAPPVKTALDAPASVAPSMPSAVFSKILAARASAMSGTPSSIAVASDPRPASGTTAEVAHSRSPRRPGI